MGHVSSKHLGPIPHMARVAEEAEALQLAERQKRPKPKPSIEDAYMAEFGEFGVSREQVRAFMRDEWL